MDTKSLTKSYCPNVAFEKQKKGMHLSYHRAGCWVFSIIKKRPKNDVSKLKMRCFLSFNFEGYLS